MKSRPVDRIFLIIMDGTGVGELPDAGKYGDTGSNTLVNTAKAVGGLSVPTLESLGLARIAAMAGEVIPGVSDIPAPRGAFGRMAELSAGKDTTTGHWEISGIILNRPFPTYPDGFPEEVISAFEEAIGRKVLGNKPASGTEIIEELGEEHMRTGYPIVYTSADSVFQIAAHEDVIPVQELYEMCKKARAILTGEHNVGRVIARPFVGRPGHFERTERRRDFSIPPPEKTMLDYIMEAGLPVVGVGKIEDIFAHRGLTESFHTGSSDESMEETLRIATDGPYEGLIFTNCVDFDTLYGHRNDSKGFALALERLDAQLSDLIKVMREDDALFITADHGCDPTTSSTDHSREYVPLLVTGAHIRPGVSLGTRSSFADAGKTICQLLGVNEMKTGTSFMREIVWGERD
ncbi:MAG TPA: phosphopentomutase [Firmicutes bacterium]|nr:phosphopentomutase [Bacillota bacterium]